MVKILDCTTRDGGHKTKWNFNEDFVFSLMECLNNSNISYYEIGYRNHYDNEGKGIFYNCNPKFLEKFYKAKGNLELGVMTDTSRYLAEDFQGRDKDNIDFVRIACHPDRIRETLEISKDLHNKGYKVLLQLMEAPNIDEAGYLSLFEFDNKDIFETVYLADSYSTMHPNEIEKYFNKMEMLGYKKISFHAHNKIQLALKNTLKAIEHGAYSVDVTLDGIGRDGNLDAVKLLDNLKNYPTGFYKQLHNLV
ncbi:hypothetical protein EGQ77_06375 [bacterium]|nr:hypothetical protein [bacterium]